MDLKTGIFSLALGTLLLGSAARADGAHWASPINTPQVRAQGSQTVYGPTYSYGRGDGQAQNRYYDRDHDRWYRRTPQPQAPYHQQGRYELKYAQQWVPGSYQQVWVPESCSYRPRWGTQQCTQGHYDQQWVNGHYESVEQWVWVRA